MNSTLEVCIIGAGPRGLSVLERLLANERRSPAHSKVTVHVVDPSAPGAGTVWRAEQSQHLLMNTVASQITVFTDDSAGIDGPIEPGPSLYEWAQTLALLGDPTRHDATTLAEAGRLGPDSYPTRAFYGRYLKDCFERITGSAPAHVEVLVHRSRAVAAADTHGVPGGPQGIRLENGTRLNDLDAIIMAQGHVPARLSAREARTASLARIHHLTYVTPANPADLDLSGIEPGQNVLLRGLGLNFFDHMALFTLGRGGRFERRAEGGLVYRRSGSEPKLFAFSRRGVPYHARGENEKGATGRYFPRLLTPEYIATLRERAVAGAPVNFGTDLWPLISREVQSVYYRALLAARGERERGEKLAERYLAAGADTAAVLDSFGIAADERWDWERLSRPYGDRVFADRADFTGWLLDYLRKDVAESRRGNVSGPLKAALDVLRDLRNEIRLAVDHGGLEGGSHRDDLEGWYTPLNAFLSIGPPASRIEEMIALIEAGVLTVTGPGTQVRIDTTAQLFIAHSASVPGEPVAASALVEARLPEPDLRRTDDPLLRHLLDTDQAAPFRIAGAGGGDYETGGLAVTERPYRLLDGRGRAHPRRFAYGVPTESVHWVTAAGIRPGVDSVTLGDSDAIARTVLELPPVARVPDGVRPVDADTGLPDGVIV
ncbi:FAD-binding protein [Streptomyces sp. KPB2]|uniref:FAD/NAD(P)-binding protein n=1 Tax=Streptomyces TaxID=1883 RepID=UPI000F6ECB28|nr:MULTISPECIES: FAD/NAD(P)-binding protein [Streptomyces]WSU01133.1 FAD/NAD(P)-binding protein [Streptomyces sp. NBC_01124]AZM75411.1 FAD-binding protein [Streptomyces sp. KPB2]MBH5135618.1 FAD/NAD(P)-binding protein [Streptomyces sp. HB-N217]MDU0256419.1 FAD/NAD(P)-binding protein [Streptomyces sp. PU10]QKW60944.1 FAD/NAD(P)-binding protein [Streptomyces sp. NA03103]